MKEEHKKEVKEKMMEILLVFGGLFLISGIVFSLIDVGGLDEITGLASVGEVNVSVIQKISLNLTFSGIDFGSGYVESGYDYAYLETEEGSSHGWNDEIIPGGIVVENAGNTDLNITFRLDRNTTDFIGGTNPQLDYKSSDNETGSCTTGLVSSWISIIDADYNVSLCENLSSINSADSIDYNINLSVPSDAEGIKQVLITFEGSLPE